MRTFLWTLLIAAAVLAAVAMEPDALAFHDGGAGECEGCHTMHNSSDGTAVVASLPQFQTGQYLLKGGDASSVCLNCHQQTRGLGNEYHISTPPGDMPSGLPPTQFTPGGDFGWLKKNYSWMPTIGATPRNSYGDSHGHNVIAMDYGYVQDSMKNNAPGGSYPSGMLSCISCHDPHGRYRRNADGSISTSGVPIKASGSYANSPDPDGAAAVGVYRLLGGAGYHPKGASAGFAFTSNPPAAVAPLDYNRSEDAGPTRVAYGAGMSEWCRNCHPNIHGGLTAGELKHPVGNGSGSLGPSITSYYNQYVKDGDLSGVEATAYSSLVPFETGNPSYPVLKQLVTATPLKGPNGSEGTPAVMCLTCHRAHAGGWDGIMRWNARTDYIAYNGKYSQQGETFQPYGQGRSEAEAAAAYYNTPAAGFAPNQPGLCNKCHASVPQ